MTRRGEFVSMQAFVARTLGLQRRDSSRRLSERCNQPQGKTSREVSTLQAESLRHEGSLTSWVKSFGNGSRDRHESCVFCSDEGSYDT